MGYIPFIFFVTINLYFNIVKRLMRNEEENEINFINHTFPFSAIHSSSSSRFFQLFSSFYIYLSSSFFFFLCRFTVIVDFRSCCWWCGERNTPLNILKIFGWIYFNNDISFYDLRMYHHRSLNNLVPSRNHFFLFICFFVFSPLYQWK